MNVKRLIGGLSGLVMLVGLLFFFFGPNGLADPHGWFWLGGAGPIVGIILVAVGATGFVLLWSLWRGGRGIARRLLGGLSGLLLLAGALAFCFGRFGLLDPSGFFWLGGAGPIVGMTLALVGAVGLIVLWSLNPPSGRRLDEPPVKGL